MSSSVRIGIAEAVGTAILVIGGPGTAILAGEFLGGSTLGVALAFGFALLCAVYAIGSISGCHINPAVTIGSWVLGKTNASLVPFYLVGQVVGGLIGGLAIFAIANGVDGFNAKDGFASNGWGNLSPGGYNFGAMVAVEIILTGLFVLVVVSTLRKSMPVGFAGLSVGLMLALVHLVSIPVDNTSVNPARSIATAVFQRGDALEQLWAFIVFPAIGGALGGLLWKALVPPADA
jgi:aquaporin Z